ncbi:hypothetical protein NLU13_3275 [Sarocladium strictum]|uniref:Methyltransferase domain-containing protein n=1 Tax=Sarocladium strictum TaxID=5046 RepID=A0AA39LA37_SARSR|nr:hypothetical protein NLU13_3275 [Sarocladium strictum]
MASPFDTQANLAKRIYSDRASNYEDSWHPDYTSRFMSLVDIKPGDRVMSLACGTGLEIDIAAPLVGAQGLVVGVDVTEAMMAVAKRKLAAEPSLSDRVRLINHDVTNLETCREIEKGDFDWIICSSAFVLFDDPAGVVRQWKQYLRPGGRMAIDITHEHNLRQGLILERVAKRLGIKFPCDRSWNTSSNSFKDILENEGMTVERLEEVEKELGKGDRYYDVSEAEDQFDYIMKSPWSEEMTRGDVVAKARPLFVEEWNAMAVDGKVKVTDNVYVYIAKVAE